MVAVKVSVEGRTNEGVDPDGFPFDQNRFKGLNPETVKRRGPVQENGVLMNDFFQDVPDFRFDPLHHFFGGFDGVDMASFF